MSSITDRSHYDPTGGERRQLTLMCCDVVDSTGISERQDPEDVREILQRYQDICSGAIERFGGTVSSYSGDGIMAQFGWPMAIEKSAIAAVRAALSIIGQIRYLQDDTERQFRERPQVRIGIQTGVVVIGDMGSARFKLSDAMVGEAPIVATRLQAIAAPDSIVVGDAARALLENRFELRPLGPQSLKGLSRTVSAFDVRSELPLDGPLTPARRVQANPFVGRDSELAALVELWRKGASGAGQSVLILGDAGIGKSRLVRELRAAIRGQAAGEVSLSGSVHHRNVALHPLIEFVRHAAGVSDAPSGRPSLDRLIETLAPDDKNEAAISHLQQLAFGADVAGAPERSRLAPISSETRGSLHRLLCTLLLHNPREGPLLMMIEDAHWLDPSSLEVLGQLLGLISDRRVLLLITSREDVGAGFASSVYPANRLVLGRLSEAACRSIARSVAGDQPIPETQLRSIEARWDGSPLFAEELALAYVETGAFAPAVRSGLEDPTGPESPVPAALHDSLLVRLEHLDHGKKVAQVASVLGRTFPHDLLASMHGSDATTLEAGLSRLIEAHIIERAERGTRTWYRFKHALLRDAAYQSMLRKQRRALHSMAATALENSSGQSALQGPDLLSQHWAMAGEPLPAAQWGLRAARLSAARSSNAEAMSQLQTAFEQVTQLPQGAIRDDIELEACIAMIGPLIATRGYGAPEVADITARAIELCRRSPPDQGAGASRVFPILYCQWSHKQVTGQAREAHELAVALLRQAEMQTDSAPILIARRLLGTSTLLAGAPPAEAREYFESALALYDARTHAPLAYVYGTDFGIMSKCHLALALWILGSTGRARQLGEEAQRDAEAFGHANTLGYALTHLCLLKALQRDLAGMAALARRIMELSGERGLPFWSAVAQLFFGGYEAFAGDPQRGVAMILGSLQFMRQLNLVYGMPVYLTWLGEACMRTGNLDSAERHIGEALAVAQSGGERWFESEGLRLKAQVLNKRGRIADSVAALRQSIEFAAERQERSFVLRSTLDLVRLLAGGNEALWHEPPARTLAHAYAPFTGEVAEADQAEARALMQVIAIAPPHGGG